MAIPIRINQGRIVPWQFRLAGTVLVFMLIMAAFLKLPEMYAVPLAILISFLLPTLWSSYYVLEINTDKKQIADLYWIVGLKKGTVTTYQKIDRIFINKVKMGQRITSYSGHVHNAQSVEYTAFLKVEPENKFELIGDKNPDKLKERLKPIIEKLGCKLVENFD